MMPMSTINEKLAARWKDAANGVFGLWLAASPWILSYATEAVPAWNARVVGVIIAIAAIAALIAFQNWGEWVNTALAAWLLVSPFLLGFNNLTSATANQIDVAVLVGGLALASLSTSDSQRLATKS
jgi:SPW repeat